MPDFGIGEALAALLVSGGIGAETAGIAAPILVGGLEGAGIGAAGSALTGGKPAQGALYGGLLGGAGGGLGELIGGGAGAAGAGADVAGSGSAFGSIASDAAGGATIAQGVPLASTYGPVSAFATDVGLAAGDAGAGIGSGFGSGLSVGDSVAPAVGGGFSDLSAFSDAGGGTSLAQGTPLASTPGAATSIASDPVTTVGPGLASSTDLASNSVALGGVSPTAPGPGSAAFAPPTTEAGQSIDLSAGNLSGGGGNLFQENATLGGGQVFTGATDTTTNAAGGAGSVVASPVETGATWDSLTPATFGTTGGPVDAGAFTTPGGSGGGVGDWLGNKLGKAGDYLADHPFQALSTGVSALGLGKNLLTGNKENPIPGQADLAALAKSLGTTGTSLIAPNANNATAVASHAEDQAKTMENYLSTGTLPPAVQAFLDRATQSAITNIKAKYASRGMPPGSTPEQQDIASLKQNAVIQGGTLAAQLYSQGVSQDQLAAQIYQNLIGAGGNLAGQAVGATTSGINTNIGLNNATNSAIANLSSALGGGSRVVALPAAA